MRRESEEKGARWPEFAAEAARQNLCSSVAVPMRLRDQVVGYTFAPDGAGPRGPEDRPGSHLNGDGIGILTHRTMQQQVALAEQPQTALNSRIVIEQAKGVAAESNKLIMDEAFALPRPASRGSRRPLSEIAAQVARANRQQ